MTSQSATSATDGHEPDVLGLFVLLWRRRWFIAVVSAIAGAIGVAYALLATEWYQSRALVVRVENRSLPSALAQFGSLANLAGISLGGEGDGQASVAVLRSRDLVRSFIEQQELLPILFSEKWDPARSAWEGDDPKDHPDLEEAVDFFDETVRTVSEDRRTGVITVAITWKDRALAATWANLLIAYANERLREQALTEAQRNVDYLRKEMADTEVASLRQAIGAVLESEMQKLLFSRGRDEFAVRVIDRAMAPKHRVRPRRTLIVLFCLMLGGAVAAFVALVRPAVDQGRKAGSVPS